MASNDQGRHVASMSLRRILGYRWHDYMSDALEIMEAGLRQLTCIVRERQLRIYGHMARRPPEDLTHRIISLQDPRNAGPCRGGFVFASGGVLSEEKVEHLSKLVNFVSA